MGGSNWLNALPAPMINRDVLHKITILFVMLIAFGVRVGGLTAQSMWRDEVDAIRFAQAPPKTLLGYFTQPGWNGPLFYVLLRPWLTVVGHNDFGTRFFSLFFGVLSVALVYRLGRRWFSPEIGGLAALWMAFSPYMVWYSQELKMYALLCALVPAWVGCFDRALERGGLLRWTAAVLLGWMTMGTHVLAALMLPVLLIFALRSSKQSQAGLLALAVMALPGVIALPWVAPMLIKGQDIGHRFTPLNAMIWIMLQAFSRGVTVVGGLWPMGAAILGLLAGTVLWTRNGSTAAEEKWRVVSLWIWLLLPVLVLYLITLRVPLFVDRYLIWIGPAFYLLIARGVTRLWTRSRWMTAALIMAVNVFFALGLWVQTDTPIKSDFRAAAAFVREYRQPDELIMFHISYVRYTFEHYYGPAVPSADGIPTDDRTQEMHVDWQMRARTAGYPVVWLVLSEPEMWDRRGMTVEWFAKHAHVIRRADFARVSVIEYRLVP